MQITAELARAARASATRLQQPEPDCGAALRLFEEATAVARRGHYRQAETLVLQALKHPSAIRAALWDLLAKIHAQQGRYLDAESCWREALELAPGTPEYLDGLRTITGIRQSPHLAVAVRWTLLGLAIAVCGYLGMALHEYLGLP